MQKVDYEALIDDAMRSVVASAFKIFERDNILGDDYCIYISFLTKAQGVQLSKSILEQYPEEITIVLHHQFEDLVVDTNKFSVSIAFNGLLEVVIVPFHAITSFTDVSAGLTLSFSSNKIDLDAIDSIDTQDTIGDSDDDASNCIMNDKAQSNVISFKDFQKSNKI